MPRLPRETKVDVAKCHACHVKRRWMSPSATPAMQSAAAPRATNSAQARHQIQPGVISAMPATPSEGGCRQVPRLPSQIKVNVAKFHACHVKRPTQSATAPRATNGAQARHHIQPTQVSKCQACHANGTCVKDSV